jgi:hypothetical protein
MHDSVAPDNHECGARNAGFSELRLAACIHMAEIRPLRLCVARPSKACQQNERATDIAMDRGYVSHSFRPTARLPND